MRLDSKCCREPDGNHGSPDMHPYSDQFLQKPKSAEEFIRCIIWKGWDQWAAFDAGSKLLLSAKPQLVRESISALQERSDLTRYTHALTRIVDLSDDDEALRASWKHNLTQLRALLFTSAIGTSRQRAKLLEIAQNKQVVNAMRYALGQEREPELRRIEPTWIAVLYAEGFSLSKHEADRFNAHLPPELQALLLGYYQEEVA